MDFPIILIDPPTKIDSASIIDSAQTINSAKTISSSSSLYPEVTVVKDFSARDDKQLSVFQGDILELLDDSTEPNWNLVRETFSGKIGYVPVEICESVAEKQARVNARINSIIESKKTAKDVPLKKSSHHGKSVSFVSKSPEIIPVYFSPSLSTSPASVDENVLVLEEKFEAELNLRKI